MSPKNKIKLNLLRKKLDKIDNQLLKVVKKRTVIVKKVLLLNSSYEPLNILNAKKAIIMMLLEKVEYVEKTNIFINSVNSKLLLPSIVKLKSYFYIKKRKLSLTRKNIFMRDNNICQYCNKKNSQLTIDHVIPKYKGGYDSWENLVSACSETRLSKLVWCMKREIVICGRNERFSDSEFNLTDVNKNDSLHDYLVRLNLDEEGKGTVKFFRYQHFLK